ncbi:MAG: sensor histidine kinase, partial [Bacteriovorax sp.]
KRLLIRNATQRINDIANDLLAKGKLNSEKIKSGFDIHSRISPEKSILKAQECILLSPLIDGLVSEKRIQYRNQINIRIDADLKDGHGCFVIAESRDLMRLLSNLVNNSVEAFSGNIGEVTVALETDKDFVNIRIKDNGCGIPHEVLNQLGEAGVSFGKDGSVGGNGLGIYHAKKCIEEMHGHFEITSQVGVGTQVNIRLPRAKAPSWFLDSLVLHSEIEIYCLDDDLSIHQIWKNRLECNQAVHKNIFVFNFTSAEEFKKFIQARSSSISPSKKLFLIDFEFLGQGTNGLEVIQQLGILENTVLVTGRYEEAEIKLKCTELNIKLLPKSLAGFVPIIMEPIKERYNWVLIDDDELIHIIWKAAANKHKKKFIGFKSYENFLKDQNKIDKDSLIFIDVNLGQDIKGVDVAKRLYEDGFKKLYLATGFEADHFPRMEFIQSIIGKEPPINIS